MSETKTSPPVASGGDPDEAFFAAARQGVLVIQRCDVCGRHQFALPELAAAVRFCRTCTAPRPPWVAAEGTGIVVSFTVMPGRRRPDGETPPPRVAGIVELVEGPWVHAAIDSGPDTLAVGQAVRAGFADGLEPDRPVPVFRPV